MMLVGDASAAYLGEIGSHLRMFGRAIEPIYRAVVARRNAAFDAGRNVHRVRGAAGTIPVISIGNLSVGGTGKTPMVMHVLRLLLEHEQRPCVAMRGYSKSKDGAADETDAYRRAFPDVPIVAQPDRLAGLRALLDRVPPSAQPDCIVLDDGFQHRTIARELDVALIDATPGRSVFEDRLLPAGWLREPVESLGRAGAVVLTHAELATGDTLEKLTQRVRERTSRPIAVARHVWTGFVRGVSKERPGSENRGTQEENGGIREEMLPLDVLIGRRVVGCCAIGNPIAFTHPLARTVDQEGRPDSGVLFRVLPDHDPFSRRTVAELCTLARNSNAEFIVVTDKDWSKLRHIPDSTWPCPVLRPDLALVFDSGREEFDRLVLGARGT